MADAKSSTGLRRKGGDKFYTSPEAVRNVMRALREHLGGRRRSPRINGAAHGAYGIHTYVEPSAGGGAFLPALRELAAAEAGEVAVLAYDLEPRAAGIVEQDFLLLDTDALARASAAGQRVAVVGNPPFGRQSGLARRFIKKCCAFASVVAFVLPRSFKKPSMQRAFARCFHLALSLDMPPNSFLVDGRAHDVPCVFQVWERRETDRPLPARAVADASKFAYTKGAEGAHAAFRRVGVYAGRFHWAELATRSPSSHYFVRFVRGAAGAREAIDAAEAAFEDNNTVGARSISKQELTRMLNRVL